MPKPDYRYCVMALFREGNIMESIKNFFRGLSRSTKITLISCASFLLLTLIILLFFVLFPITPSEKIITGLGRSGIISTENGGDGDEDNVVVTAVTTTAQVPDSNMIGTAAIGLDDYSLYDPMATYTNQQAGTFFSYIYSGNGIRTGQPGYSEYTRVTTINPEPTEPPYAPQTSEPNDTPQQTTAVGGSQTPQTTTAAVEVPQATEPIEKPTEAPKVTEAPEVPQAPPKEQEVPAEQ